MSAPRQSEDVSCEEAGGHRLWRWPLADQVLVSGVNFLTGILVARGLGLVEFGLFAAMWLAVLFMASLQQAAVTSPMLSIGPQQPKTKRPGYYGAALAQQAAFAALCATVVYIGAAIAGALDILGDAGRWGAPLAAVVAATQLQDFFRRYFFARERPVAAVVNDALAYLGRAALLLAAFHMGSPDSAEVLWLIAASSTIGIIVGFLALGQIELRQSQFAATARRHWQSARWLLPSALLQWTSGNLFLVAAGGLLGPAALGAMRAAQGIFGVTNILSQGLENVAPVRFAARYGEGGLGALRGATRWLTGICGGLAAAFGVAAAATPEFWLTLIYGDEFAAYGSLLRWYAVIYLIMFLLLPVRFALRTLENTKPLFLAYAGASGLTLASFYPLLSLFGLAGAMVGILGTQAVMMVILWVSWRRAASRERVPRQDD